MLTEYASLPPDIPHNHPHNQRPDAYLQNDAEHLEQKGERDKIKGTPRHARDLRPDKRKYNLAQHGDHDNGPNYGQKFFRRAAAPLCLRSAAVLPGTDRTHPVSGSLPGTGRLRSI